MVISGTDSLEIAIVYKAYFSGLCFRESPVTKYVQTYDTNVPTHLLDHLDPRNSHRICIYIYIIHYSYIPIGNEFSYSVSIVFPMSLLWWDPASPKLQAATKKRSMDRCTTARDVQTTSGR